MARAVLVDAAVLETVESEYRTEAATNAKDALRRVMAADFDAVFTDDAGYERVPTRAPHSWHQASLPGDLRDRLCRFAADREHCGTVLKSPTIGPTIAAALAKVIPGKS